MKRALLFVLPQALLIPSGFFVGLVVGVVAQAGGWAAAIAQMSRDGSSVGPGHADIGLFAVLAAVAAILLLAVASSVSLAGISAGLVGASAGFVLSCLIDWALLFKKRLGPGDAQSVKRWAGRGAVLTSAFCFWIVLFNPLRDVAGVWAVTGMLACLGFGAVGLVRLVWTRLASKAD
jgi:hypothetical protein